jgi:uncharacterized membrane protein
MNTLLWVLQSLMAVTFFVPGIFKLIFSEQQLVAKGMAGVEGLPLAVIRFIGIMEILGAIGIILPMLLNILPELTVVSAIGFALIMIPAEIISCKRHEYKKVFINAIIFLICIFISYGRMDLLTSKIIAQL